MTCQWTWSIVWPAAGPLLTITLRPSAPVASRTARQSRGRSEPTWRGEVVGQVGQVGVVIAWGPAGRARVDRVDVEEGHGPIGLEHAGRGDLAADDLAEEAVGSVGSWSVSHATMASECSEDTERNRDANPSLRLGALRGSEAVLRVTPRRTTAGRVGALTCSSSPSRAMTAIGAASPWRTLASL